MNIQTKRLILIPVCEEHIEFIFKHFNEKIIIYMFPSVPKDISETHKIVQKFIEERKNGTDYVYAITLKTNQDFIGLAGLHHLKNNVPELGIWIKTESHGHHYGREAIGGIIKHACSIGIEKLCYPVDRRNIPSKKIPLFFGGKLIVPCKKVKTPDNRILEEEIYEIEVPTSEVH